jgi:hypothetical protein
MANRSSGGSGRSALLCCNQVCQCSRRGMIIRNTRPGNDQGRAALPQTVEIGAYGGE